MEIKIDASPLRRIVAELEQRGRDLRETTPQIAEILVAAVADVFEAEGPGWPGLAESTLRSRRGGGGGAKILQDTGRLAGSIQPSHGDDWGAAGTGVGYGLFHVTGTGRMPARDFLAIDFDATTAEVADLLLADLART